MNSLNLFPDNFEALSLQAFYDSLGFFRERYESGGRPRLLRKPGILKEYLEVNLVITLRFEITNPSHYFYLVVHRVPFPPDHEQMHVVPLDTSYGNAIDMRGHREADCVFQVCDGSERSDQVVAAGVRLRSRIWLMSCESVPKPLVDPSFLQEYFEVSWASRPREVDGFTGLPRSDIASRKCCLIEGMSQGSQCFGGFSSEFMWKLANELDFSDVLTGMRIDLDNTSCRIRFEKLGGGIPKLSDCFICPTDSLLRWRKLNANRITNH